MTFSRVNLSLNPALQGGMTWRIEGTWTPSTALHASLPRQTGLVTATGGGAYIAPAAVVPGRTYVGSLSLRAIAASAGNMRMGWWRADGSYIGESSEANPYSTGANTTARLSTLACVAPAGAAVARVYISSVDGAAQVTAGLIEQTSTIGGSYFDGATAGATWAGDPGQSPSRFGISDLAGTVEYDDLLGRIRTFASGADARAGRLAVLRRPVGRALFEQVRGSSMAPLGGGLPRSADDYEFPDAEGGFIYRVAAYSAAEPLAVPTLNGLRAEPPYDVVDLPYTPPAIRAWLKFVAAPHLNRKVTLTGWDPIERPARNTLYDVDGRPDPVVVTSGHSSRRTAITLRTFTRDETDALDESLTQGIPGFLHLPRELNLPSMYCVFGTVRRESPARRSIGQRFTVPLTEVAAPPASIFATGATWQSVLDGNASWLALLTAQTEWRRVTS